MEEEVAKVCKEEKYHYNTEYCLKTVVIVSDGTHNKTRIWGFTYDYVIPFNDLSGQVHYIQLKEILQERNLCHY